MESRDQKPTAPEPKNVDLKEKVEKPTLKPKDRWDKADIVGKMLFPVALAFIVFLIKDSVDLALKKEQLEVSSAKDMENLISVLRDTTTTAARAEGAALALSAYGRTAIAPLINELNFNSEITSPAVKSSLFFIGLTHHDDACQWLRKVLANRGGRFLWTTHLAVIELIGQIGCTDGIKELKEYALLIPDDSPQTVIAYARVVSAAIPPSDEHTKEIRDEINRELEILEKR